jgi:hypothetical protein
MLKGGFWVWYEVRQVWNCSFQGLYFAATLSAILLYRQ